jgi:hypothetical protein
MTFQLSEYSDAAAEEAFGKRLDRALLPYAAAGLAVTAATVFGANPLVMKAVLPESSYATRTVAGLLLTPLEFLAVRAILNRK